MTYKDFSLSVVFCSVAPGRPSREFLIESIKDESLKAQIIGKAYRIKFKDLERFIDEL